MKPLLVTSIAALLGGAAVRIAFDIQAMGPIMLLVLVVLPIVGLLTTFDDDLPGGFSNSDGKSRAPWRYWENWADLAIRASLSGVGFAVDAGWSTSAAIVPWIFGVGSIAALMMFGGRIYRGGPDRQRGG